MTERLGGINEVIVKRAIDKDIPLEALSKQTHISPDRLERCLKGRSAFFGELRVSEIFTIFEALDIPLEEALPLLQQASYKFKFIDFKTS